MEWKIGEIFEYQGEWHQCVEQPKDYIGCVCDICSMSEFGNCELDLCLGTYRKDRTNVIFKKLEKVGEPYMIHGKTRQQYKLYHYLPITNENIGKDIVIDDVNGIVDITIKQDKNKEDMEENKLNLKPFDLEEAKAGKPVYTKDGAKVRIICFDAKCDTPIIALVTTDNGEEITFYYLIDGTFANCENQDNDLMMLSEKHEGWVNVVKEPLGDDTVALGRIFSDHDEAVKLGKSNDKYIATVKIEWEE